MVHAHFLPLSYGSCPLFIGGWGRVWDKTGNDPCHGIGDLVMHRGPHLECGNNQNLCLILAASMLRVGVVLGISVCIFSYSKISPGDEKISVFVF